MLPTRAPDLSSRDGSTTAQALSVASACGLLVLLCASHPSVAVALVAGVSMPLFLGMDAEGGAIVEDLARMPHLLIAGTTGSGKSVCINCILASLLLTRSPHDVQLILVDP